MSDLENTELILGNSNPRFSGVTSTMLQVLRFQKHMLPVAVMGKHHLPDDIPVVSFMDVVRNCRRPLTSGRTRVFHARRNNEVLQALALKKIFGVKIKIAFTSTAQREHTWITRWLIRQSDGIITTSSAANQYIHGGADIIVPHGIDLDCYHPTTDKSKAWQELGYPGKYGIGIFGRVRHQKGIDLLVDAAIPALKKHEDFTVIICGETTPDQKKYEQALRSKIEAEGMQDRFVFIGKQPFDALPNLFRAMHLVTALSRNEGFGLTVLEAMASGTAVLASEAGAWKEIVTPGSDGMVVPCEDIGATTSALNSLLEDPDKLITMGTKGREHVEQHYSLKREAQQLCNFLTSL